MDKIGIVYFSGTGNTKFVARIIKRELERYNKEASLINIEKNKINTNEYKSIIIGGPIYVDRYPEILIKYLEENLNDFKGKCMLFSTQVSDKEAIAFQHCIHRVPYLNITYTMFIPMPNNFYNFMFKKASKEEENKLLSQSIFLIRKGVKDFLEGNIKTYPNKNISEIMINCVYNIVYPYYVNFVTKKITIDNEKCVHCKLCEKNCPVQCIKITDGVSFNKDCVFCQRCMNNCPKGAFEYKGKSIIQYSPDFRSVDIEEE